MSPIQLSFFHCMQDIPLHFHSTQHFISHTIGSTDLLHPSPAPHFTTSYAGLFLKDSTIGPYPEPDESIHNLPFRFLRPSSIVYLHLRACLQRYNFRLRFSTRPLCTTLFLPVRTTCPAHRLFLDFVNQIIGAGYKFSSLIFFIFLLLFLYGYFPTTPILRA